MRLCMLLTHVCLQGLATAPVLFACREHPSLLNLVDRKFKAPGDVEEVRPKLCPGHGSRVHSRPVLCHSVVLCCVVLCCVVFVLRLCCVCAVCVVLLLRPDWVARCRRVSMFTRATGCS